MSHPQAVPEARVQEHGQLALFKGAEGNMANRLACLTCHNPHSVKSPHFLKESPDSLCANCHQEHLAYLGGAHDFTTRPELKNSSGRSAAEAGKCGFCHAVHNALGPVMWTATSTPPVGGDDVCLQCHKEAGLAVKPPGLRHPTGAATTGKVRSLDGQWPLFNAKGELEQGGSVGCGTCHDLHGSSKVAGALLRHADPSQSSRWCLRCHADQESIEASVHSESMLKRGMKTDPTSAVAYCGPCHSAHERAPGTGAGMWSGPMGPAQYSPEMRRCLGCHGSGGAGPQVRVTIHPIVPMRNDSDAPAGRFLPLVNQQGRMGGEGRITCQTCHLPHGRAPSRGLPAVEGGTVGGAELRAMGTLLRPYSAPNLCSGCHGFDGLKKYLYYHYPEKRRSKPGEEAEAGLSTSRPAPSAR
jgi:predicted CXXCH cytochrome family protein